MSREGLALAVDRMRARGMGPEAIKVFEYYYEQLEGGAGGTIPEDSIEPLGDIQALGEMRVPDEEARRALSPDRGHQAQRRPRHEHGHDRVRSRRSRSRTASPSSTSLPSRCWRCASSGSVELPLDPDELLPHVGAVPRDPRPKYTRLAVDGLPLDFIQNAEPKLRADDLMPVDVARGPGARVVPARAR